MNPLAWGAQLKAIVLLSVALAGSVYLNATMLKAAWVKHGEAKGLAERNRLAGELEGFRRTDAVNTEVAKIRREDHTTLLAELDAIAARGQQFRTRWRQAPPLPAGCQPGPQRMDAVNDLLSGKEAPNAQHP